MNTTLSVYFGSERTYVALLNTAREGLEVMHANVFPQALKSEYDIPHLSQMIAKDLAPFHGMVQAVNFSIPIEKVYIYQVPNADLSRKAEIKALLNEEIKAVEPEKTTDDFSIMLIPGNASEDGSKHMLAVLTDHALLNLCKECLSGFKVPITFTQNSQFAAHSACITNYPEYAGKSIAIFGVQDHFIDVSVLHAGNLAFYSLYGIPEDEDFGSVCGKILTATLPAHLPDIPSPDLVLLYGEGLKKNSLDALSIAVNNPTQRFNAFRSLLASGSLGVSAISLCNKAAHLFPPVIGAYLKPLQEKEVTYL
ncbi:MAG: hypothetical protein ACK5GO_03080 [Ignavibacteria bacterium]|jgi:hypothetical protein